MEKDASNDLQVSLSTKKNKKQKKGLQDTILQEFQKNLTQASSSLWQNLSNA